MFAPSIDQSRDGAVIDNVQAAAEQRKSLIGEISNWRREIQLAGEPWLHRVLIGRNYVGEMSRLKRSQMRIDNLCG